MAKTIHLKHRPEKKPKTSDFGLVEEKVTELEGNKIIVKLKYVSVDPYLRGRMRDQKSYIEPFKLNEAISSACIAEVIKSNNKDFETGSIVHGMLKWKEEQLVDTKGLRIIENTAVSLSAYLGVLGMTGLTAYLGLTQIGKPKSGETLLVSGAAGAVGSTVGQIGKILGLKVVGIAGTDEKIDLLINTFGFDDAINYKSTENMSQAIKETCENGVDIYFDNVGGEISDAVLFHINKNARIINCGAISVYNKSDIPKGLNVQPFLIKNSALMQGFIVRDYEDKFKEALTELTKWLQSGEMKYEETIVEGFDKIPEAFIGLFDGDNKGKMVVKI